MLREDKRDHLVIFGEGRGGVVGGDKSLKNFTVWETKTASCVRLDTVIATHALRKDAK